MKKSFVKVFFLALGITLLWSFMLPDRVVEKSEEDVIANSCTIQNTTFQTGEEIVYKLYYNWNFVWFTAGEVVFRVKDLGTMYHLSAHGRTYKSYDWFFKVRDKYDTYVDKETLLPIISIPI